MRGNCGSIRGNHGSMRKSIASSLCGDIAASSSKGSLREGVTEQIRCATIFQNLSHSCQRDQHHFELFRDCFKSILFFLNNSLCAVFLTEIILLETIMSFHNALGFHFSLFSNGCLVNLKRTLCDSAHI